MGKIYALSFWWKFSVSLLAPLSLHAPGLENRLVNEVEQNKKIVLESPINYKYYFENQEDGVRVDNYIFFKDSLYFNKDTLIQ